jgi:hypothetical protein
VYATIPAASAATTGRSDEQERSKDLFAAHLDFRLASIVWYRKASGASRSWIRSSAFGGKKNLSCPECPEIATKSATAKGCIKPAGATEAAKDRHPACVCLPVRTNFLEFSLSGAGCSREVVSRVIVAGQPLRYSPKHCQWQMANSLRQRQEKPMMRESEVQIEIPVPTFLSRRSYV